MMYSYNNHIQTVGYLREICRQRKQGYTKAAEFIKQPDLQKLFIKYAKQSDDFEYDLMHYVEPSDDEAFEAAAVWDNFEEDLEKFSIEEILDLCQRKEKSTIGHYEEALEEELPEEIESLLNRQLIEITTAYDAITDMVREKSFR